MENPSEWIEIATGPKRFHHGLAYSTAQSAVIMFGGEIRNENPDRPLNKTWSFTGGIWNQKNTPMAPPERAIFAMAYDKKREVTVIFGGSKSVGDRGDTWEFDGTNWTQKFPTNSPITRVWRFNRTTSHKYSTIRQQSSYMTKSCLIEGSHSFECVG